MMMTRKRNAGRIQTSPLVRFSFMGDALSFMALTPFETVDHKKEKMLRPRLRP